MKFTNFLYLFCAFCTSFFHSTRYAALQKILPPDTSPDKKFFSSFWAYLYIFTFSAQTYLHFSKKVKNKPDFWAYGGIYLPCTQKSGLFVHRNEVFLTTPNLMFISSGYLLYMFICATFLHVLMFLYSIYLHVYILYNRKLNFFIGSYSLKLRNDGSVRRFRTETHDYNQYNAD